MELQVVVELVGTIARVFSHIPYAVVGLAAMVCHGLPGAKPSRIVLACPGHAKDVVRGWAIAQGLRSGHAPNLFSVMSSDGKMRVVEIGYIECGFEALAITHMGADQAKVLSLATIANLIATAYVRELTIATINHHRQDTHANDLRWVLCAMIERGERLSYPLVGSVMTLEFWVPFTTAYPDTVGLFADAGLAAEVDPDEGFALEEDFTLNCNDSETSSRWSCEGTLGFH
ncbi:uncharacterized protein F5Z01DRAFT_670858 [Emericellopsis atlantica]|uniref:Uncharacterized protein n=1 Tax=Emericellopsis atlantica TaxID=2614577 RepID=A0A9P8CSV8_9HYPO|nr:uncharacterized protein F5Z01DRAFT_670858 [Emericellopsis atlantica]KAG9258208.1 hypothetical protein F5Z01DRAFT_670858 [Emericellopsis atlantica]